MKLNNLGEFLFKKISGFEKYYFKKGYDGEELLYPYTVISVLVLYSKENYLDNNYNIIGDKTEFYFIMKIISDFLNSNDNYLSELALIGFIEGISQQVDNNDKMNNLRNSLYYEDLQIGLDKINKFFSGEVQ